MAIINISMLLQAEMPYKKNPKLLNQLQTCEEQGIPFAVVIASSEKETNTVKLRHIATREEVTISRNNMIAEIKARLQVA